MNKDELIILLAPGVTIGVNVKIGTYVAICLIASVIKDVTIGEHAVIGASPLENKNVEYFQLVYGIPAKTSRMIRKGEKYLYKENDYVKQKKENRYG